MRSNAQFSMRKTVFFRCSTAPWQRRQVLLRARAPNPQFDVRKELPANEAAVRVMLKDYDVAVDLIAEYLTVNPDHRRGFANRVGWYWRDLQGYPKFQRLIVGLQ